VARATDSQKHRRSARAKTPTSARLENAALYYLSRYAASEFSLRRVLENRVRRASLGDPLFACDHEAQAELRAVIENIVARHRASGILDDAVYAGMKARGARRQGRSARMIKMQLAQKGLAAEVVEQALRVAAEDMDAGQAELAAARILAKRRKWGPFGPPAATDKKRKQFAAMARAGFSLAVVKRVLSGDVEEDEESF